MTLNNFFLEVLELRLFLKKNRIIISMNSEEKIVFFFYRWKRTGRKQKIKVVVTKKASR